MKMIIALFLVPALLSAANDTTRKTYVTKSCKGDAIVIDGRLDDKAWNDLDWATDFTQREPDDGAEPTYQTAFKITYDAGNLYVGVRAYDDEPEKIVRRVTRRDRFEGDWVEINIDSYFDHRTAFSFTINAAGVKGDEAISNDGDIWDGNWNPIWHAKVASDKRGWTAEMQIPFSQLRFAGSDQQTWGIQMTRRLFRKDERSVWQYIPRDAGGWVSYFGELHGVEQISAARKLELLPYSVSDHRRTPKEAGNPFATGHETNFSGGLDAKVALTSDLTVDLTVNPDFGQVEADPSEVNLSAFETFFPEKRPFFIEGNNILDYRLMTGDGGFSNDRLFYSRRIGRPPQHEPDLDDDEYMVAPDNTSIVSAMKLTGKTAAGLSIGVLNAITEREVAQLDLAGERQEQTVEPLTNYFVGRVQKDYNRGNTSLGGMFTATNRRLNESQLKFLNSAAYSGGIDFRHQWHDKTYYFDMRTSFSHIRGDREAITEAQEASQRYYQRPDADYVSLDTTRTSLSGHGGFFNIGKAGSGNLRGSLGMMWRSPGLELNDIGFMREADRMMQWSWLQYRINNPVSIFRQLTINFNQWAGWNFGGESVFKGGNINGGGQFKNYWRFWTGIGRDAAGLSTSALRGGPALRTQGSWSQWWEVQTDDRRAVRFGVGGNNNWEDGGHGRRNRVFISMLLRPKDAMQITLNPFYTFNEQNLQYIDTVEFGDDDRFLFGRLHQKTIGITIRLDYSITPDLSIQYYGQPFLSAGRYTRLKRITDSRAARYNDRFATFSPEQIAYNSDDDELGFDETGDGADDYTLEDPDFNFRQFRSNLVVRWEYSPGSTLFLVWSQERTDDDGDGRFAVGDDLSTLFGADATNIFLVKVSRWFSL